jgi:hypothetical protein
MLIDPAGRCLGKSEISITTPEPAGRRKLAPQLKKAGTSVFARERLAALISVTFSLRDRLSLNRKFQGDHPPML